MALRSFWVAPDGEGEPTVWTGTPERPRAVLRRCDIAGDDAVRDEVMGRLNDPEMTTCMGNWRCTANSCSHQQHFFSGWEDGQRQIANHARTVAHDPRWPLTLTFHDTAGRQYAVDYTPAVMVADPAHMGGFTDAADTSGPYAVGNDQQGETT